MRLMTEDLSGDQCRVTPGSSMLALSSTGGQDVITHSLPCL